MLSSSRSIGWPESFRTRIVVFVLKARVPKFSDSLTSYSAVSFRLVALTLPGTRPGFAPVETPRSSRSPAVSRAGRGGFVEPAMSEGAGVGDGSGVVALSAEDRDGNAGPPGGLRRLEVSRRAAIAGTATSAIRASAARRRPRRPTRP